MLKQTASLVQWMAALALMSGCAFSNRAPVTGFIYMDEAVGESVTSNGGGAKRGEACASSILGLVGTGDATIEAAKKNGSITTVTHVDSKSTGILGIYATYCTQVIGD
jgi:hypothetical protein